jgi:antitoxin component of MazEF toxin-antitoxin module
MLEKESFIRKFGNSVAVIIPADVWKDSSNKFEVGQKIKVKLSESGKEIKVTKERD